MAESAKSVRWIVHFQGRVQGVGFRYSTAQVARNHPITGYVTNLPNGQVQLVVEGLAEQVAAFVDDVRHRMASHIRADSVVEMAATREFDGFDIH